MDFTGYKTESAARNAASRASTAPGTIELRDGTFAGVGDPIARGGKLPADSMLYGARGATAWQSEAAEAGIL